MAQPELVRTLLAVALLTVGLGLQWRSRRSRAANPTLDHLLEVHEQAKQLRKTDPAAADRMIAAAEAEGLAQFEAELADLRRRAPTDPAANQKLRDMLTNSIKGFDLSNKVWRKQLGKDPTAQSVLSNIAAEQARLRAEIDALRSLPTGAPR